MKLLNGLLALDSGQLCVFGRDRPNWVTTTGPNCAAPTSPHCSRTATWSPRFSRRGWSKRHHASSADS